MRKGKRREEVILSEREGLDVHTDTLGGRQNNHIAWVTLLCSQLRFIIDVGRRSVEWRENVERAHRVRTQGREAHHHVENHVKQH